MKPRPLSKKTLKLLRKYDTPTVCNVIELFNVRSRSAGYMDSRIKAAFPEMPPMVGYAATATFRSAAPSSKGAYMRLQEQVAAFAENPGPPIMVFQDLDDPAAAATFGEVMCTTYQAFGAVGLITSGPGRDLDQVRDIGFPVFTNGANCSHGYCHMPEILVPVRVGGIAIDPGDLLHGDCNGVTTIPHDIASEVGQACEAFMAAEAVILDYLKGGDVTPEGFAKAGAECGAMQRKIAKEVAHP